MRHLHSHRFTLVELVVGSFVVVILMASILPFFAGLLKATYVSSVKSDLRGQLNMARGWLMQDIEGTAQTRILTVADSNGATVAFSLPMYRRASPTAVPLKTGTDTIDWTDQVIYYFYKGAQNVTQFCRAVVPYAYFTGLSVTEQQALLTGLVQTGTPQRAGLLPSNILYFRPLLRQVETASVHFTPTDTTVEGYAAALCRATVPLGTALLSPGPHRLTFRPCGRNALSSSYGIGIDSFVAGPAGLPQEAEHYLATANYLGATPVIRNMAQYPNWRNNAILDFPVMSVGPTLTVSYYNDTWWESLFNDDTATSDNTQIAVLPADSDQVVQMVGGLTSWSADSQPVGAGTPAFLNLHRSNVRVLLTTPVNGHNGKGLRVTFKAADLLPLRIVSACVMEQASGFNGTPATVRSLLFAGAAGTTIAAGGQLSSDVLEFTLDPARNYLVSFYVRGIFGIAGAMQRSTTAERTAVLADSDADLTATADWSAQPATLFSQLIGVSSAVAMYPQSATYTSRIVDTRVDSPTYQTGMWHGDVPAKTGLTLKYRAGMQPNLSDAPAWASLTAHTTAGTEDALAALYGRYVQFQATFTAEAPYAVTASLRDVKTTWPGTRQLVQFSAELAKGPDRGRFEFLVDDVVPRPTWVRLNLTASCSYRAAKYTDSLNIELQPRNR